AGLLVGRKGELEALWLGFAGPAHCLGGVDLIQGGASCPDGEEEGGIRVATSGPVPPVVDGPILCAAPSQGHAQVPPQVVKHFTSRRMRLCGLNCYDYSCGRLQWQALCARNPYGRRSATAR